VKRVDLIKAIKKIGCELVRHGGRHDWYRNPRTGVAQPVPRHREIKEVMARRILRMLGDAGGASGAGAASET
jgi:predicted RNA binding protein YcfA (HicA-like mRNA interferase family)